MATDTARPEYPGFDPRSLGGARNATLGPLLAQVALGDRAAFARVYELSAPQLFPLVLRMLRDRPLAEDVLQEVYVNVWQRASSYRPDLAPPMAWLCGVARNAAISALRRPHLQDRPIEDDPDGGPADDPAAEPLARLLERREQGRLHQCLQLLSGLQRQMLALAFFRGMAHAELSDYLQQPLGTVKTRLRRALQRLRECLET